MQLTNGAIDRRGLANEIAARPDNVQALRQGCAMSAHHWYERLPVYHNAEPAAMPWQAVAANQKELDDRTLFVSGRRQARHDESPKAVFSHQQEMVLFSGVA